MLLSSSKKNHLLPHVTAQEVTHERGPRAGRAAPRGRHPGWFTDIEGRADAALSSGSDAGKLGVAACHKGPQGPEVPLHLQEVHRVMCVKQSVLFMLI